MTIRKQIKRACAAAWGVTLATPASTAAAAPKPASKEQIEQHLRTLTTDPAVLDALRAIAHPAPAVAATVRGLTDAQIAALQAGLGSGVQFLQPATVRIIARAIEAAHGIATPPHQGDSNG